MSRLVDRPVASSPQYGGNPMAFDGGMSECHREPDGGRDADMSGKDYAWSMDRSDGLPQHDGNMDPWRGDPSSLAAEVHRNRSVDNQTDASEEAQEWWPKEAPHHHCHLVLHRHSRGRAVDDCHWRFPLSECS